MERRSTNSLPPDQNDDTGKLPENAEIQFPTTLERQNEVTFEKEETAEDGTKIKTTKHTYETREFVDLEHGEAKNFDLGEYEPPERDEALPDLNTLMTTLQEGEDQEMPSLFRQPENVPSYKKITELQCEIEKDKVEEYVSKFEEGVRDDVVMIGSISLEEVQEEEKRLRDEHIAYREQEKEEERDKMIELKRREEEAKKRVDEYYKTNKIIIDKRKEELERVERLAIERMQKSYLKSESQLISCLENRKGEVKTYYGDLATGDGYFGGSKGRRWKVDWERTPQPIQIKLKSLRGVKDKLPGGRYVVMVSLYNRLGGHVLRWSQMKGQMWGGSTEPITHDGLFHNTEIKLDQSVFTTLPSRPDIRPGMVLVFEIFLLRGAVVSTDRVVGWGVFPIADGKFEVVEGKYKCPFLRGEMDYQIDKHEKVEELMSSDMDHWLCNMYFEVIRLPRYLAGQKEYEVELQFSSGMLGFPDRINTGEEYRDGEAPIPGSLGDIDDSNISQSRISLDSKLSINSSQTTDNNDNFASKRAKKNSDRKKRHSESSSNDADMDLRKRRPVTTLSSRRAHREHKVKLDFTSDSETDYDEDDAYIMKKEEGFYPVKGQAGLWYKKHRYNPQDHYFKKYFALLPRTPILNPKKKRKKLTYLEQLEEHSIAVKRPFSDKGRLSTANYEKLEYVGRQMMAELGLSQWRSREFWGMLLMFLIVFWLRLYMHYIGQWIFLQGLEIPINKFDFLPYTVNLNYQNTLLQIREEVALVLLGPLTNIILFVILVVVSWGCQRILGMFPDIGSKFTIAMGLQACLDPFLIAIVDSALRRWRKLGGDTPIADYAKLYWTFQRIEGSGLAGIFITVLLYAFTCFAAGAIVYMYFLRLHNNGRMLDIYWRLHGEEDVFFIPYDLEISNHELSYLVKKAEQWRGEEGERRKVAVYDYVWEEETVEETVWDENGKPVTKLSEGKKEITTHISIHTLHLDGLKELYRHFLRLPDGAICEVFGDVTIPGMDKDVTKLIQKDTNIGSKNKISNSSLLKMAEPDRLPTAASTFRPMTVESQIDMEPTEDGAKGKADRFDDGHRKKGYPTASKVVVPGQKKKF
ncbi:DgyrCDS2883 [Dimorphilus gyrociliatus]|uniref:DgyrCDS2883 n=1 Tax=Dimorphilus gyrociliatus TaxID=2664684 RepID=A0A7I8VGN7_9ANNE|nr:DgyrCDS2883 [Dimorphilus gyrociliatus]